MASKEAEANAGPPSYEESTSYANPNFNSVNPSHVTLEIENSASPASNNVPPPPAASGPPSMFLTARTSMYGPNPIEMDCPHCQAHIVTHITRIAGMLPWLIFGALAVMGLFLFLLPWCFCCLPFLSDPCLDVIHSCPCCKRQLGRYNRM